MNGLDKFKKHELKNLGNVTGGGSGETSGGVKYMWPATKASWSCDYHNEEGAIQFHDLEFCDY